MRPETDLMQHVRGRLQEMAEPDYAEFSRRLLPSGVRRLYGVRVPQLRALARELVSAYDWDSVFRALLQPATFEEQMLCGLVLGYGCHDGRRWLETVDCFVGLIDNWSVCDSCCATFKIVQRHRELFWPYLLSQAHSPEQYRQRFALVVWLGQYGCGVVALCLGARPTRRDSTGYQRDESASRGGLDGLAKNGRLTAYAL